MERITNLLYQANVYWSELSNAASLESSEYALDIVQRFIELENELYSIPNVFEEIEKIVFVPPDASGSKESFTWISTLMLARSGCDSAVDTLIQSAKHPDYWISTIGRLNISWLIPSHDTLSKLKAEFLYQKQQESPEIPLVILVDALIRQLSTDIIPLVQSYLQEEHDESNLAAVLSSLVTLMPDEGLALAAELEKEETDELSLTALGLQAIYNNDEAYEKLLDFASPSDNIHPTVLRWLGRIPRPESLPILLQGLNHLSGEVRFDVITCLAYFGTKEAREAVINSLHDPVKEVSDQAMALVFDWLGEDLDEFYQHWNFDQQGRLTTDSCQELANIARSFLADMEFQLRYYRKSLMLPEENLEDLYLGIQPGITWYHWVATTGVYKPYDLDKNILYNFPSLELLEDWYSTNHSKLQAGKFYYHGQIYEE